MDPVSDVKKGFNISLIITILVVFIFINLILSLLDLVFPLGANFIRNPVGTVQGFIKK